MNSETMRDTWQEDENLFVNSSTVVCFIKKIVTGYR